MQRPDPHPLPLGAVGAARRDRARHARRRPDPDSARAERAVLRALARMQLIAEDPCYLLENERARRALFDVGVEALCRAEHGVTRTAEDHLALFRLLDWPRASGATIAELLAAAAAELGAADAPLLADLARARLVLVRATTRAGDRVGFEDLDSARVHQAHVPPSCPLRPGEVLITRFHDPGAGRSFPIVDMLQVPFAALGALQELRAARDLEGDVDPRAADAARLFQAWTAVTFGDAKGEIDPARHLARAPG